MIDNKKYSFGCDITQIARIGPKKLNLSIEVDHCDDTERILNGLAHLDIKECSKLRKKRPCLITVYT